MKLSLDGDSTSGSDPLRESLNNITWSYRRDFKVHNTEGHEYCKTFIKVNFTYEELLDFVRAVDIGTGFRIILVQDHSKEDLIYHVACFLTKKMVTVYFYTPIEDLPLLINDKSHLKEWGGHIVRWRLENGREFQKV
jgi:hypothetical protein